MSLKVDDYSNDTTFQSRSERNSELYKQISKVELEDYEVKSNATVIGDNNGNSIDVEKIKSILDTHYKDVPKRNSMKIESEYDLEDKKSIFETKEYDINTVIDRAKEDKIEDYNEERNKKLHNTQFDILSNLNIEDELDDEVNSKSTSNPTKLQELIDTIALNEKDIENAKMKLMSQKGEKEDTDDMNPLDMFEDLKGSGDTQVLEGLQEETENFIDEISKTTNVKKVKKESIKDVDVEENDIDDEDNEKTSEIDKSFYTKSNDFSEKDYEDFSDVEGKSSIFMRIIIIILLVVFAAGIVILVKQFL